jgi:hypothetical protein
MKSLCRVVALILGLVLFATLLLNAAPLERSISPSRQFIIYGPNVALRGAMGDLAERTKASLVGILQKHDDWQTPIILNLQFRQANTPEIPASQLHVSQTGIGLKLQLDLTIADNPDRPAIQRDLLRAIFVELIYRNHRDIPVGAAYAEAPPWLIESVMARNSAEQKQTLGNLLTSAAESEKIIPLSDFLRQKPDQLDSQGRLLYRAYAAALLQFLLEQPAGATHLSAYVESLSGASNDPLVDLKARFPGLEGSGALDVLWKTAVAKFASTDKSEFLLTFSETQRQLEELLRTSVPPSNGKGEPLLLEQLGGTKPGKNQVPVLRSLSQNLLLLSTAAHPLLRPVVVEYEEVAQRLASRNRAKSSQRLARAKAMRARLASRMTDIDDYMNWFEATQLRTSSGTFTNYLKAAGTSGEPEKRRRDALSVYLDAVEAQFQN